MFSNSATMNKLIYCLQEARIFEMSASRVIWEDVNAYIYGPTQPSIFPWNCIKIVIKKVPENRGGAALEEVLDVGDIHGTLEDVGDLPVDVSLEEIEEGEVEPRPLPDLPGTLVVGQRVVIEEQPGEKRKGNLLKI